ncbi:SAM-dependent methyltransferase [Nonomuraea soli]|uniref:O-methyltransferase involved in polyketide biosynthesis n=1 Tax=Nonomuraea soli TaxID=1032476 RepID=A0A7W0CPI7_9ACTN|nr:SAM-dependent methyltransferase [Nonomuraea soli]MBA2894942.1 O-methyltransferase involved in polyketide biosynthesis [Nonomuraea soli]
MSEESVPAGIDPTVPSAARIYDYFLGGKDNFASDRAAAEHILALARARGYDIREAAWANRAFLGRVVRELAAAGVRQFLDIGTGLPTRENVHQIVREAAPDAKVVYVDNDPIVLVHARALLEDNARTIVVHGDLREPAKILADPQVRAHLDLDRPVAVLVLALLHFFPEDDYVDGLVGQLIDGLPSGGYLAVSHGYAALRDAEGEQEARDVYSKTSVGDIVQRPPAKIAAMMARLEMLEPGVVPVETWRPHPDQYAGNPETSGYIGGVGRKS